MLFRLSRMICESDPIRLTQGSSSLSHEWQYLLSWVAHVGNIHIGNDYVQIWFKVSQQRRHHWIWMPTVWAARRGHPCPQREAGEMAMQGWFQRWGPSQWVWEEWWLFLGGTLFLSSAAANALGTEIFALETETAGLAFWRTDVAQSVLPLVACFADPGSLLPQKIACIAFAQKQP